MPKRKRLSSWKVSDAFLAFVEPHIPQRKRDKNKSYKRKAGAGRKPLDKRGIFFGDRLCSAHWDAMESSS